MKIIDEGKLNIVHEIDDEEEDSDDESIWSNINKRPEHRRMLEKEKIDLLLAAYNLERVDRHKNLKIIALI